MIAYKDLGPTPYIWLKKEAAGMPCPSCHHLLGRNSRKSWAMFLEKLEVDGPYTFTDHQTQSGIGRYPQKKKKKSSKVSVQTVCLGFAQQQQRKQIRLHSEKCKPGLCLNKIALLHGTTYTTEVFGNLFRHYQSFS